MKLYFSRLDRLYGDLEAFPVLHKVTDKLNQLVLTLSVL